MKKINLIFITLVLFFIIPNTVNAEYGIYDSKTDIRIINQDVDTRFYDGVSVN